MKSHSELAWVRESVDCWRFGPWRVTRHRCGGNGGVIFAVIHDNGFRAPYHFLLGSAKRWVERQA